MARTARVTYSFEPKPVSELAKMNATLTSRNHLSLMPTAGSARAAYSHKLEFYAGDVVPLHDLNGQIGSALMSGSSAIVIATSGHLDTLAQHLKAAGVDLAKAKAEGRYIALDASELLPSFMVNDRPDAGRFSKCLTDLIERAEAAARDQDRRVIIFEEMVALLLAEGKSDAAMQLKKLGKELAETYTFSLPFANFASTFPQSELATSLLDVSEGFTRIGHDVSIAQTIPESSRTGPNLVSTEEKPEASHAQPGEEFLRLFVNNVQDYAVFMLDRDGHVASWNIGAERIKGYKASEIIGQHFSIFYPREVSADGKPQRLLAQAAKEGYAQDEGWRLRKDGSKFWAGVTITAVKDPGGRLIGFGKITRDLTDRKRSEMALHRSEERARRFIEGVLDYAIFMLDPDGFISSWNVGAERIKGYKASQIIGQHFSCFYPEEDIRAGKPAWELEVAKLEGRFEDEGWRVRKDGSRFWANVIITPIVGETGDLLGFTKVTRDFTERMTSQRSLEESRQRLKESEESLRKLSLHLLRTQDEERRRIGREIHDSLGQYLSVLKIKLDSMISSPPAPSELEGCANLLDACLKEVRTISYLLYPPMLEEMGLKSAVLWYLDGFSQRSGIQTTFESSDDVGRLGRDIELVLFRVLQESLTNVQRHSASRSAKIRISKNGGIVSMQVSDHGKGLPPAILEQGSQDWMGSLGVGLRGMSERLRQLGGTLDVSSSEQGTTLCASVPVTNLQSEADK